MLKSTFPDWLKANHACQDALDFVGNKTLKQAWAECNRPDWMFWLLDRLNYNDRQTLRLYACWCAANTPLGDGRKTWDLLTDNRSRKAILVAIDYANGEATTEELAAARDAAFAATWAAVGDAATAAAFAATWAAAGDAAGSAVGDAVGDAASCAAGDAAEAAATAAQANELRRRIPFSAVLKLARKAGIKE